ncbi:MAG: ligase-associated DNA damage response DEXH box helicase [Bacteroidia bacterium]
MPITSSIGYTTVKDWFEEKDWKPFPFQEEVWQAYLAGKNGLLNAPTGSGKTFALWMPLLIDWINQHPDNYKSNTNNGLRLLWITPLRALTADIKKAMQTVAWELNVPWLIKVRTGDTSSADKQQMKKLLPEVLITTPESLHIMLAQKDYPNIFKNLQAVVVDEWHELLGSKRGVQVELGLSRLKAIKPDFRCWGVSATIGNLEQGLDVLLGEEKESQPRKIVKADPEKKLHIESILPDEVDRFPWAGHLGLKLVHKLIPIIQKSQTTLIFINTRGQTEIWYKHILEAYPELAGMMALHHGSLDRDIRNWVEEAIHDEKLKVVICTSSLDLGVDFAPVETVIQVGSPKSVARFLQRAGRSGHRPGATSVIYFVPTHSLELIEAAALKEAIQQKVFEDRPPMYKPFDVLIQYMVTLAVSEGFFGDALYAEVKSTYAFKDLSEDEWSWLLDFITNGGPTLKEYDEYQKVVREGDFFKVTSRRVALRHRMSIGTIVSDPMMFVKLMKGGSIGAIEESFISRLKPGDIFWFAGRSLELVQVKEMTAYVRKSTKSSGTIPRWSGERMSLSEQLAGMFKQKLDDYEHNIIEDPEIEKVRPLLELQHKWSAIPTQKGLLIEKVETKEGHHIFIYPFAGRYLHEGLAALIAYRLAQSQPITFSIAMNDYGFELLSEDEVDLNYAINNGLFSTEHLHQDMLLSLNSTEMAKRRFREIAQISGLLFTGFPGKMKKNRHLQASAGLLFDVFKQYDPENLLLQQAYDEVFRYQLSETQLHQLLTKIQSQEVKITTPYRPTPFAFPIMVDRLREKLTSEKLEDRIKKLQLELEEEAG